MMRRVLLVLPMLAPAAALAPTAALAQAQTAAPAATTATTATAPATVREPGAPATGAGLAQQRHMDNDVESIDRKLMRQEKSRPPILARAPTASNEQSGTTKPN